MGFGNFEKVSGDDDGGPCPTCKGKPKKYEEEHGEECPVCGGSGKASDG
jgi:DnaJ-class molecular chaperone